MAPKCAAGCAKSSCHCHATCDALALSRQPVVIDVVPVAHDKWCVAAFAISAVTLGVVYVAGINKI